MYSLNNMFKSQYIMTIIKGFIQSLIIINAIIIGNIS